MIIHALGFAAEASDQPKFQYIRRLAEETGGFRREVRVGSAQKYTISNQFVAEALENGGTATITLREPPGPCDAQHHRRFQQWPLRERRAAPSRCRRRRRARANSPRPTRSQSIRARRRAAGLVQQAVRLGPREQDGRPDQRRGAGAGHDRAVARSASAAMHARRARLAEEADEAAAGDQVVYGWLEMLDGNASRYPLQTTNVRIGRHRDNDICLMNDFDLAAACAPAFRCGQAHLRHHRPRRRQRRHRQQGQAAVARSERRRSRRAWRGTVAVPHQRGGHGLGLAAPAAGSRMADASLAVRTA